MVSMPGHLFVIRGDLTRLACDGWLLPTDEALHVTPSWWRDAALRTALERAGARPSLASEGPWALPFTSGPRSLPVPDAPGPRPYFTWIGSAGEPVEWYLDGVRAFLGAAAATDAPRFLPERARRLLGVPVVGTGFGGMGHVAGRIHDHLLPMLAEEARRLDVDIALVCADEAHYAAAQATRRRLSREPGVDLWPELDEAAKARAVGLAHDAANAHLVLFLGAGVSMGAGLPSWTALLSQLAREAGLSTDELRAYQDLSALDRAQFVGERLRQQGGERGVGDEVRALFARHRHHGLAHGLLAGLPVAETITTNYDTLFEQASADAGHPHVSVLPYAPTRHGTRWLLKMHGCVEHPEDIVLTREDYLRYVERNAALAGIVQAMLLTKHMLFVGFSLEDDNFLRIVDAVRRAVRGWGSPRAGRGEGNLLGCALMTRGHPLLETLWSRDLPWVCPGGREAGTQAGARAVEVFLDLLAHHASSHGHLLDGRFDDVLDTPERALRDALRDLARDAARYEGAPAWRSVQSLLRTLGHPRGE